MILSPAEALSKREELIQRGYTSIPKVMPADLVEELRAWSDGIFARTHVQWDSPRAATPWSTRRGNRLSARHTRQSPHTPSPARHPARRPWRGAAGPGGPVASRLRRQSGCRGRAVAGRRPADRRRPPAACGVAQPERPAPHPAAGLARRVLVPGAAKLVDRGDPRRRQKRRSHGAVRSHQDPQSLHRLTARVCRSAGLPILARLPSTVFVCNTMYSTSVAYNSWRSGCQEQ